MRPVLTQRGRATLLGTSVVADLAGTAGIYFLTFRAGKG
jgi:hypothetical protein